ncbi:hypothetical protein FBR04_04900 [Betaproteobacteria bacterium PRO7]|nr:hypothetical protein [Betaproteobacteria bacterium PRO7]
MDSGEREFELLLERLESRLGQFANIGRDGDLAFNHDYYGNQELGVILLRPLSEFMLVRAARDCLAAVLPGWEVWFTPDQSLGNCPCLVVSLEAIRHVSG